VQYSLRAQIEEPSTFDDVTAASNQGRGMIGSGDKSAAVLLKEADERLRAVLDSVGDGSWDWNIRSGEVFYSDRWLECRGFTRQEVRPHVSFWEGLIHPDDVERVWSHLSPHIEGRTERFVLEYRLRHASGDYRWMLDRGRVVERDHDGDAIRMVGTNCDLSEEGSGYTRRMSAEITSRLPPLQRLSAPMSQARLVAAVEYVLASPDLRDQMAERAHSPEFWPEFFAVYDSIEVEEA